MLTSLSIEMRLALSIIFVVLAFVLGFLAIRSVLTQNRRIERRLATSGGAASSSGLSGGQMKESTGHLLDRFGSHLTLPDASEISRIRHQLAQAGFYDQSAIKRFYALRIASLFMPQFVILLSWRSLTTLLGLNMALIVASVVIFLGLMLPIYVLRWRVGRRRMQCKDGFPDVIDLLVASIEAGLSIDMALSRITTEIGSRYPVLKDNMDIMNMELRAGRLRHEAMMGFAERIDLEEAKALCVMLKQSEDMGSSMGKALRTFSEDMREKRMLLAEEKAMALSAKMTVPLILFIFPTLMVMLLVPAAIRLMEAMS